MPYTILRVFLELLGNPSNWYKLALSCPVISYLSFDQNQSWVVLSYLNFDEDLSWAVLSLTKFSYDRNQGGPVLSYLSSIKNLSCVVLPGMIFDLLLTSGMRCSALFKFGPQSGFSCPVLVLNLNLSWAVLFCFSFDEKTELRCPCPV